MEAIWTHCEALPDVAASWSLQLLCAHRSLQHYTTNTPEASTAAGTAPWRLGPASMSDDVCPNLLKVQEQLSSRPPGNSCSHLIWGLTELRTKAVDGCVVQGSAHRICCRHCGSSDELLPEAHLQRQNRGHQGWSSQTGQDEGS